MNFLRIHDQLYIAPDEIACVYLDRLGAHLILKHHIFVTDEGVAKNILNFDRTDPTGKLLLAWAKHMSVGMEIQEAETPYFGRGEP